MRWFQELDFERFNPEAVVLRGEGEGRELVVFSDDGNRMVGGIKNAELRDASWRSFRWRAVKVGLR